MRNDINVIRSQHITSSLNSVLLVGNFLSKFGYSRAFIEDLADQLQGAGWFVHRTSSVKQRFIRLADMIFKICSLRRYYYVAHVDVFSGPAFIWAEVACFALTALRKPFVLTLHGGNLPVFALRWPKRVKHLLNTAVFVHTPSNYLLEQMLPYRLDLMLIPNPLDLRTFDFQLRCTTKPSLIWLRAFNNIYNPLIAPEVVDLLTADFPDVHLTMVGPDTGDGSLQLTGQKIKDLEVIERVCLPGGVQRTDVPVWLQKGDIFINTTNVDNTPISVLEAMACGLPVVSTDVGGIPYLLKHEQDALLVPPDDPKAMAQAVERILTEPGLAERLSRNARQKVEKFDWSVILPQWERLFEEILQGVGLHE